MNIKVSMATLLLACAGIVGTSPAAAAVLRCDSCSQTQVMQKAQSGPLGYTYVVDYGSVNLTLWEVTYDGEVRRKFAEQLPVDQSVSARFFYMVEGKIEAQAKGDGLIVVNISPDQYNGTLFSRDPFGGYSSLSAYDIVNSVTLRNSMGTKLAQGMSATKTGNVLLDDLGVTLNSVIMSMGFPTGFKIVITWKDGSKTSFTIDSATANQAQYVAGESKDSSGNPIPDASATTPSAGGIYGGEYRFDTSQSLEKWVQAAINYGIPVTGGGDSRHLRCTWDGETLRCHRL